MRSDPTRVQRGFLYDLFCGCFGCCGQAQEQGETQPLILGNPLLVADHTYDSIMGQGGTAYTRGTAQIAVVADGSEVNLAGADDQQQIYTGSMQYRTYDRVLDFGGFDASPKRAGLGTVILRAALDGHPDTEIVRASNVTGSYGFYAHLGFRNEEDLDPVAVAKRTRQEQPYLRMLYPDLEKMEKHNIGHFQVARHELEERMNLKWTRQG